MSEELKAVYNKSWGRRWETRTATIDTALLDDDMMDIDMAPVNDGDLTIDQPASRWEYTCLVGIQALAKACQISGTFIPDVIVVREEYIKLREALEAGKDSFLLTGQPGIGKTIFLIYLLLHRLESRLPTAIQFGPHQYILFDENGANVHHHTDAKLSDSCWALTDSNTNVTVPCIGFQGSDARIVYTTSPRPDRWKDWFKHSQMCDIIVVDLPKRLEIAAIAPSTMVGFTPLLNPFSWVDWRTNGSCKGLEVVGPVLFFTIILHVHIVYMYRPRSLLCHCQESLSALFESFITVFRELNYVQREYDSSLISYKQ